MPKHFKDSDAVRQAIVEPVLESPPSSKGLSQSEDSLYGGAIAYRPAGTVSRTRALEIAEGYAESQRQKGRPARRRWPYVLIGVILCLGVVGAGLFWWSRTNRVRYYLNGEAVFGRAGITLAELIDSQELGVAPGDLVSVTGTVLAKGEGEPYAASVNGVAVGASEADARVMAGGDQVEVRDGGDVTEEFELTVVEDAPRLVMQGEHYSLSYVAQWGFPGITETRVGKSSGETLAVQTQERQDCVVVSKRPQPQDGERLVALTFDDGPSQYTQRYLDILSAHGAVATFFCLGVEAQAHPELVQAIVAQGSQVASHTHTHENPLSTLSAEPLRAELANASLALEAAGAPSTSYIRPPYGDFDAQDWLWSDGAITASIRWTEDSLDWKLPGVESIVYHAAGDVNPGSIILMHDGGGNRDQDLEALPRIISQLQGQGYRFVTMEELLRSDPEIPEGVCSAQANMPEGAVWPTELMAEA